jgi:hypothetical protein
MRQSMAPNEQRLIAVARWDSQGASWGSRWLDVSIRVSIATHLRGIKPSMNPLNRNDG